MYAIVVGEQHKHSNGHLTTVFISNFKSMTYINIKVSNLLGPRKKENFIYQYPTIHDFLRADKQNSAAKCAKLAFLKNIKNLRKGTSF